jgi:hypothetical protein
LAASGVFDFASVSTKSRRRRRHEEEDEPEKGKEQFLVVVHLLFRS